MRSAALTLVTLISIAVGMGAGVLLWNAFIPISEILASIIVAIYGVVGICFVFGGINEYFSKKIDGYFEEKNK